MHPRPAAPTRPHRLLRPLRLRRLQRPAAALTGLLLGALVAAPAPAQAQLALGGTPSASWRVNGTVYAEVVVGDTLVVGGEFSQATSPGGSTAARANLAAFSMSSGSLLTGWTANTDGRVRALVSDGSSVWVGGAFKTIGGAGRPYVAKLSASSGAVAAFNPKPNSGIRALALTGSRLYLGGTFTTVTSQPRASAAVVDATSGSLGGWAPQVNGPVYALAVNPSSGVVYVGGDYTAVGSASRASLAAVDPTTAEATPTTFTGAARPVLSLSADDSASLYGGIGGGSNSAFKWSSSTGSRSWKVTVDGDVQAVLCYEGLLYAGFHDGYLGNTTTKLLAINGATGAVGGFRPTFDQFYGVWALAASPAGLAAGGTFTKVSGVAAQGFARFASG